MKGFVDDPNFTLELLQGSVTLRDVIDGHIYEQALAEKHPFLVGDLGALLRQHTLWQSRMEHIRPFYTVQSCSHPAVIEVLAALGIGFVCSNKSELMLVQNCAVPPEDIIYSGGCKQLSHLKYAARSGVGVLTCDNETELRKIARCHPNARLLLELATTNHDEDVSMAPGCTLKGCRHLLECARELRLQVLGIRIHMPPSCQDHRVYSNALSDARYAFDMAEELGFHMDILDIGSGFSGSETQLDEVRSTVQLMLDTSFTPLCGVQVIAELGSFYTSPAFTLAVSVIASELVSGDNGPEFLYCLSDGVYGSFSGKLLGREVPVPSVHKSHPAGDPLVTSVLRGPSYDELDVLVERCLLPTLAVGDWLLFNGMGGHEPDRGGLPVYYTCTVDDWYELQKEGGMKNFLLLPHGL